jgi:hypothetical protein
MRVAFAGVPPAHLTCRAIVGVGFAGSKGPPLASTVVVRFDPNNLIEAAFGVIWWDVDAMYVLSSLS